MTSSNFNQRPTLQVVPPTALKPTQPTSEVSPNLTTSSPNSTPEVVTTKSSLVSVIRPLLILGVIAGIGALGFIPISPTVGSNAEIKSTPTGRQTISMTTSGKLQLEVESNQTVKIGQPLGVIKSEEVKKEIAENERIYDQFQLDADLSQSQISAAESRLKELEASQETSRQRTAFIQQQLAQGESLPQIRDIQSLQEVIKAEIDDLQSKIDKLSRRQSLYQEVAREGGLRKNDLADLEIDINTSKQQIKSKQSLIKSKDAQIDGLKQSLQQDLIQKQKEENQRSLELQSARQQLEETKSNVLKKQKVASKRAIDRNKVQNRVQDLELISNFNGTIITPDIDKKNNQYFQAGSPILEIVDLSKMRLEIQIKPEDQLLVKKGQTVKFRPQGRGLVNYTGTVEEISPTTVSDSVQRPPMFTVYVRLNSPASDNSLLPGVPGYAHIEVESMLLYQKVQRELEKLIEIGKFL